MVNISLSVAFKLEFGNTFADENITFINMIFSNLGDYLTAGNNR